jgi:hypothetical protein
VYKWSINPFTNPNSVYTTMWQYCLHNFGDNGCKYTYNKKMKTRENNYPNSFYCEQKMEICELILRPVTCLALVLIIIIIINRSTFQTYKSKFNYTRKSCIRAVLYKLAHIRRDTIPLVLQNFVINPTGVNSLYYSVKLT